MPKRELLSQLKTRPPSRWPWGVRSSLRVDFLRADSAAIVGLYRLHGFLDADVRYEVRPRRNKDQVEVIFHVQEGPRSRISDVILEGVHAIPQAQLRRKLFARRGKPFDPAYLQLDTLRISEAYQEQGFLAHTLAGAQRESTQVEIRYQVTEGQRYLFGDSYVVGLQRVKENLVRRELLLPKGRTYRLSRMRRSIERLYESGLFDRVQVTPIPDSTHSEIHFYVLVHERRSRWIDGGLGTGTSERFRFTAEWGHRNLDRFGLQGVIGSRLALDGKGRFLLTRSEVSLQEPWLYRIRTPVRATGYFEKLDDRADSRWLLSQNKRGVALLLRRDLSRITKLTLTQDNTFVNQTLRFNESQFPDSVALDSLRQFFAERYRIHRLQLAVDRDARDSPVAPQRGSRQFITTEVAGGPLKGGSSFYKHTFSSAWYTPLGRQVVFATRARAGLIRPFGAPSQFSPPEVVDDQVRRVPFEDRFRLGGANSVRGYDEDHIAPSGGLLMLLGNLELRFPIWGPLGGEAYLDAGNVWARPAYLRLKQFRPEISSRRLTESEVRYTTGAGLRVNLPIAPLRLDSSWALRTAQTESKAIVHRLQFAIGPSF